MGKNKSVLSVHVYSQNKKLKLFARYMSSHLKSIPAILRHPESLKTSRSKRPGMRGREHQREWQLLRLQLLQQAS